MQAATKHCDAATLTTLLPRASGVPVDTARREAQRYKDLLQALLPYCRDAFETALARLRGPAKNLALLWQQAYEAATAATTLGPSRTTVAPCRDILPQPPLSEWPAAVEHVRQRAVPALLQREAFPGNVAASEGHAPPLPLPLPRALLERFAQEDVRVAGIPYADVFGGKGGWATFHEFDIYMNATFSAAAQSGRAWRDSLAAAAAAAAATDTATQGGSCDAAAPHCSDAAASNAVLRQAIQGLCGPYVNMESEACVEGKGGEECGPLYVFDTEVAERRLLPGTVAWPAALNDTYGVAPVYQFGLGPACAGAPLHYHEDAWNLLLDGAKLWWLQPPHERAYSSVPPARALMAAHEPTDVGSRHGVLCLQQPGDLLYVPRHWAHRTLNVQLGAGLAGEYSPVLTPPWLTESD